MRSFWSFAFALCLFAPAARAADLTFLVAPKDSPAATHAAQQANDKTVFAVTKLFLAFDRAAEHLNGCGACTVTIQVASGDHAAKGNTGAFSFPEVKAPKAKLRILGGYDAQFKARAPFDTPSVLVVTQPRGATVLAFEGKNHALAELVVSGLVFDVAAGNRYDAETNSLLKGTSSSFPVLGFGYLTTDRLVISDNIFMNSAHTVSAPLIRAQTDQAEVHVINNLFVNNVFAWQVTGGNGKIPLKRYLVQGNSFILNWPYNPDAHTSNPGTLEIGNKHTASLVEISDNLFAYNVGGAIFPQWDDKDGPKLSIHDNLFWENGVLFKPASAGHGAVVGKFNKATQHAAYDPATLEEEFSWAVKNNQVFDPQIQLPRLKLQAVGEPAEKSAEAAEEEIEMDEDVDTEDYAEPGQIKNYAPKMPYNPKNLPLAKAPKAQPYGAHPDRVKKY